MEKNEEETIYIENDEFLKEWNQGDAKAAASFYTEDSVRVGAMDDIENGREQIASAYEILMYRQMPGANAKMEKGTIRMLTPDLSIWQGGLELQNLMDQLL